MDDEDDACNQRHLPTRCPYALILEDHSVGEGKAVLGTVSSLRAVNYNLPFRRRWLPLPVHESRRAIPQPRRQELEGVPPAEEYDLVY